MEMFTPRSTGAIPGEQQHDDDRLELLGAGEWRLAPIV
jgi:hypothetical protein